MGEVNQQEFNEMIESGYVQFGDDSKKEYTVFNQTDGIPASPDTFKTIEEAEKFCKEFRERFKTQGYYRDSRWNKVAPEDIELEIIEC